MSTSSAVVIHHSNPAHGHAAAPADVLVDALPYYDSGYDEPGVRDAVRNGNRQRRSRERT